MNLTALSCCCAAVCCDLGGLRRRAFVAGSGFAAWLVAGDADPPQTRTAELNLLPNGKLLRRGGQRRQRPHLQRQLVSRPDPGRRLDVHDGSRASTSRAPVAATAAPTPQARQLPFMKAARAARPKRAPVAPRRSPATARAPPSEPSMVWATPSGTCLPSRAVAMWSW